MKITMVSGKATITFPKAQEESDSITFSIGTKMALRLARIAAKLPGSKVKLLAGCVYGLLSLYGMGGAYELIRPLIDQKGLEAVLDKKVSEVNSSLGETKNA